MIGQIFKSTGSWYDVYVEDQKLFYSARLVGKMKLIDDQLTNPVAVGDMVEIEVQNTEQATIHKVLPRKNYIARQSPKSRHQVHIIAANIDQVILVTTLLDPVYKPGFIDRFLLTTEPQNIPVIINVNKCDLHGEVEMQQYLELKKSYESIGYRVHETSTQNHFGIEDLKIAVRDKVSLFSGQSGVGKSSLLNAIQDDLGLKTQEISNYSGKGTHTTTFAEMIHLHSGGKIIDTPGIKLLSFNNLEVMDVAHNFREFFIASRDCKFGSQCTHRNEPDCSVRTKVNNQELSEARYLHYITILEEIEKQNYWERSKKY